jgi:Fe-S-cluster containining protein
MESVLDCRQCGLCCVCFFDQDVFCDVTEEDERRLSPEFVRKHVIPFTPAAMAAAYICSSSTTPGAIRTRWRTVKTGPLKGIEVNACAALRGSIMNRVSCRVYANRPEVCRTAVKPGDRACHEVRDMVRFSIERCLDGRDG